MKSSLSRSVSFQWCLSARLIASCSWPRPCARAGDFGRLDDGRTPRPGRRPLHVPEPRPVAFESTSFIVPSPPTDSDHDEPVFPDRSGDCEVDGPNQLWVAGLSPNRFEDEQSRKPIKSGA